MGRLTVEKKYDFCRQNTHGIGFAGVGDACLFLEPFYASRTNAILICAFVGLETNTEYKVRVLAGTKAGFPVLNDIEWNWELGKTGPKGPLGEYFF